MMNEFREIETWLECSAETNSQVPCLVFNAITTTCERQKRPAQFSSRRAVGDRGTPVTTGLDGGSGAYEWIFCPRLADWYAALCSGPLCNKQVQEVVFYAQRAVLHPTAPMFDTHTQQLMPRCVAALRRIFHLCDTDQDGALSDAELNAFQVSLHCCAACARHTHYRAHVRRSSASPPHR